MIELAAQRVGERDRPAPQPRALRILGLDMDGEIVSFRYRRSSRL
jgi:hypothetical protein